MKDEDQELERWAESFRATQAPTDALRRQVRAVATTHDVDRWAEAFREARTPSDALRTRILEQAGQAKAPPRAQWGLGLALGAVLGIAAVLLLAWGFRFVSVPPSPAHPPTEALDEAAPQQPVDAHSRSQAKPPTPKSAQAGAIATEPEHAPQRPRPSKHRTATPREDTAPQPVRNDLEELRQLRAGEQTLEQGDAPGALRQLEAHARAFPHSTFMLEREALWLQAACEGTSPRGLERRYRAFFRRPDGAGYRVKVRTACAGKNFEPSP